MRHFLHLHIVERYGQPDSAHRFIRALTQHGPAIYAFIRSLVADRADAEEILQETHLALWRKSADSAEIKNFSAWACGMARIEVLRFRSRQKPGRIALSDSLLAEIAAVSEERADLLEDRRDALRRCVDKLPSSDRELIERRHREGESTQMVAQEVRRSLDAVYKALVPLIHPKPERTGPCFRRGASRWSYV